MSTHLRPEMLIFGLLTLPGLFGLIKVLLLYRKIKISESWIETEGTILSAQVEYAGRSKGGIDHWASFTYSYETDEYDCTAKSKIESFWGKRDIAEKHVAEHPAGSTLGVRYNPYKPEECISEYDRTIKLRLIRALEWLSLVAIIIAISLSR